MYMLQQRLRGSTERNRANYTDRRDSLAVRARSSASLIKNVFFTLHVYKRECPAYVPV